jgi:hypothetical protein
VGARSAASAAATELLPHRRDLDPGVVAVMMGSAAVHALGEELLWRGMLPHAATDACGVTAARFRLGR